MSGGRSIENVQVYVRVRPPNDRELQSGYRPVLDLDDQAATVTVFTKPDASVFTYDRVAGTDSSQEDVFQHVGKPITDTCLAGYNGTIFAYGQTGSGKTHTIQGAHAMDSDPTQRGMMPRVFQYLFAQIAREERKSGGRVKYSVSASFLEIYNERIYDLLEPNSQSLTIREDLKHGVFVDNLREVAVTTADEICKIMETGVQNRRVGETAMNRESSRSHSLFRLALQSSETHDGLTKTRNSQFNMIDLAGSERQKSTATAGKQLKEASGINKSLSALGNVIMALVAESRTGKPGHVHYRDSKLTFLLRDALGGNSLTYIIACVSGAPDAFGETLSTLKFAQRAKLIKNRAVVNEDQTGSVEALQSENWALKEKIRVLTALQNVSSRRVSVNGCPTAFADFMSAATPQKDKEFQDMVWGNQNGSSFQRDNECEESREREKEWKECNRALKEKIDLMDTFIKKQDKQNLSNKMILRLRERALAKLEARLRQETNESATELLFSELERFQQENKILRDQLETNPAVLAKMIENADLKMRLRDLESRKDGLNHEERFELAQELADLRANNARLEAELKSPRKLLSAMSTPQKRAFESFELQRWQTEQEFEKKFKEVQEELTGAKEEVIAYKAAFEDAEREKELRLRRLEEYKQQMEELGQICESGIQSEQTIAEECKNARVKAEGLSGLANQLEGDKKELESKLAALLQFNAQLSMELADAKLLCTQMLPYKQQAEDSQVEVRSLAQKMEGLQTQLKLVTEQESVTHHEVDRLQQALDLSREETERLTFNLEMLQEDHDNQEKEFEYRMGEFKKDKDSLEVKVADQLLELKQISSRLSAKGTECEQLRVELDHSLAKGTEQEQKTVAAKRELQTTVAEKEADIQRLHEFLEVESKEAVLRESEKQALQSEVLRLQSALSDTQRVLFDLQGQLDFKIVSEQCMSEELNAANEQVRTQEENLAELQNQLKIAKTELQAACDKAQAEKEQYEQAESEHRALLEEQIASNSTLQQTLVRAEQQLLDAEKVLEAEQKDKQATQERIRLDTDNIYTLKERISCLQVTLSDMEQKTAAERADLRSQLAALELAHHQVFVSSDEKVEGLEEERRAQVASLEERRRKLQEELRTAKAELQAKGQQCLTTLAELEELKVSKQQGMAELQDQVDEFARANKQLASQLAAPSQLEEFAGRIRSLTAELEANNTTIAELVAERDNFRTQALTFSSEMESQSQEVARLDALCGSLQDQLKVMGMERDCLQTDFGNCRQEEERATREAQLLSHRLSSSQEEQVHLKTRLGELEGEVARVKEDNARLSDHTNPHQKIHYFQKVKHESDQANRKIQILETRNRELEQHLKQAKCQLANKENAAPESSKKRAREYQPPVKMALPRTLALASPNRPLASSLPPLQSPLKRSLSRSYLSSPSRSRSVSPRKKFGTLASSAQEKAKVLDGTREGKRQPESAATQETEPTLG